MAFSLFSPEFLHSVKLINWQALYLIGTIITGMFIGYEAIILKQSNGRMPESYVAGIGALLEGLWLLVSGLALYYGHFLPIIRVIPTAYLLYSVGGWLYGFYLLKDDALEVMSPEDIIMPPAYMDYSFGFATVIVPVAIGAVFFLYDNGLFVLG